MHTPATRADLLEAVPAYARPVVADIDRVAGDDRLPAAEVAVLRTEHGAIRKRLELDRRPRLRDAGSEVAEVLVVRGRLDVCVVSDRDRRRTRPVDRGIRDLDLILRKARPVLVDRDERSGGIRRGRRVAISIGRKRRRQIRVDRLHVLIHEACRLAVEHLIALEGPEADSGVAGAEQELIRGHRVRVLAGPNTQLRVVVELRLVHREVVGAPGARRIARRRDRGALVVRRRPAAAGERELRGDPATGELVVEDDRVAAVQRRAVRSSREERVDRRRRHDLRARLRPDRIVDVDDLHVVVRADVAVRVGRVAAAEICDPVEILIRRRRLRAVRAGLERVVALGETGQRNAEERGLVVVGVRFFVRALLRRKGLQRSHGRDAVRARDADVLRRRLHRHVDVARAVVRAGCGKRRGERRRAWMSGRALLRSEGERGRPDDTGRQDRDRDTHAPSPHVARFLAGR